MIFAGMGLGAGSVIAGTQMDLGSGGHEGQMVGEGGDGRGRRAR